MPNQPPQNFGVANLILPKEGPRVATYTVDLNATNTAMVDITNLLERLFITYVQGVFVDAWNCDEDLEIIVNGGTRQRLTIPANSQCALPLFVPKGIGQFIVQTVSGDIPAVSVPVFLYNVPVAPFINRRDFPASAPVISREFADLSLDLVGGGSEEIIAAGDGSNYLLIENATGNDPVSINIAGGDADASGFTLEAGGSYELNGDGPTNAVTASGTAGDHLIIFAR